jgi:hypothetical protein
VTASAPCKYYTAPPYCTVTAMHQTVQSTTLLGKVAEVWNAVSVVAVFRKKLCLHMCSWVSKSCPKFVPKQLFEDNGAAAHTMTFERVTVAVSTTGKSSEVALYNSSQTSTHPPKWLDALGRVAGYSDLCQNLSTAQSHGAAAQYVCRAAPQYWVSPWHLNPVGFSSTVRPLEIGPPLAGTSSVRATPP